ncbi:hypothetical protein KIW84_034460 [Lathyrus oleraceus]|uniref:Uncharacterized protein n=1 Tax=Pisum sativum TaxID=3888 RepID=A0A9D4XYK7_PEA|nr:hypothetical protein KIW84_034460 [Pisum sativum]
MRSLHDQEFAEFLIRIGDGVEPTKPDDMVRLPLHIAIPWEGEHSIQVLIQHIFPNLELHGWDAPYMVQRAILTPTKDDVQKLNDMIIDQFPGEEHNLLSFNEVEGDNHNLYQQEFLNSIAQGLERGIRSVYSLEEELDWPEVKGFDLVILCFLGSGSDEF